MTPPDGLSTKPAVPGDLTELLLRWNGSGPPEELVRRVYPELRSIAGRLLAGRRWETLQTTDLVHETFLRLVAQRSIVWRNRAHFFSIAARLVRRAVVDHVRERRAEKRGGSVLRVDLDQLPVAAPEAHPDLLHLDRALDELEREDPEAARVVELRYFAGLTIEETAAAMEIGRTTVVRHWRYARAWLRTRLTA